MENRVRIVSGHYGSGKSEFSVNLVLLLKQELSPDKKVAIVDLDIVNPYFRSRGARERLESVGIQVVAPENLEVRSGDIPGISGTVHGLFSRSDTVTVMDVGGDDAGARVLGCFVEAIKEAGYEFYIVVNIRRPETSSPEKLRTMIESIRNMSKLEPTHLISNTNLGLETDYELVLEGYRELKKWSESLLPLKCACVPLNLKSKVRKNDFSHPVIFLDRQIKWPWEEDFKNLSFERRGI